MCVRDLLPCAPVCSGCARRKLRLSFGMDIGALDLASARSRSHPGRCPDEYRSAYRLRLGLSYGLLRSELRVCYGLNYGSCPILVTHAFLHVPFAHFSWLRISSSPSRPDLSRLASCRLCCAIALRSCHAIFPSACARIDHDRRYATSILLLAECLRIHHNEHANTHLFAYLTIQIGGNSKL